MAGELDLVRMERRKVSYATVTANLVHRAFLHHAADDIDECLTEIHRLRALVAAEQEHKDALRERLSIIRRYIDDLPQE